MTMQKRVHNDLRITQFSMLWATLEATGHCYQATTCPVLSWQLPGTHAKQGRWKNTPTLLVVMMAMVMRRWNTVRIAQWRRYRASLEATECHHWASICSNSINWICLCWYFVFFSVVNTLKQAQSKRMVPTNYGGVMYQTQGIFLAKTALYSVLLVYMIFNHI